MIRVKYKRPGRRLKEDESAYERVDEDVEEDMPAAHCPVCRVECEGKEKPNGSYQFKCATCDVLAMTWDPPVYEPEPELPAEAPAPVVPLAQAVEDAKLSGKQKLALAAAGAASLGSALWQLLNG